MNRDVLANKKFAELHYNVQSFKLKATDNLVAM